MQGGELGYSAIRSYAGEPSITLATARYIHHLLHILAKEKHRIFSVQCEIHITGARYPSPSLNRIEIVEKSFY